jgi:hypothetical protein
MLADSERRMCLMPHDDYDSYRGAIEAGSGFEDVGSRGSLSLQEQIAELQRANQALLAREEALMQTLRKLRAELADTKRREAFLAEALDSVRDVMGPLEGEWDGVQAHEAALLQDPAIQTTDRLRGLMREMVAESWSDVIPRDRRWVSDRGNGLDATYPSEGAHDDDPPGPGSLSDHNLGSWRYS